MKDNSIELPPLPAHWEHGLIDFVRSWGRAAIEADRKSRGRPVNTLSDAEIREVFLANGFTIKDGHDDLKPYVYDAARALLAICGQRTSPVDKGPLCKLAEPMKSPSDDEIIQMMVGRGWNYLDHEERTDIVSFVRELLNSYGNVPADAAQRRAGGEGE